MKVAIGCGVLFVSVAGPVAHGAVIEANANSDCQSVRFFNRQDNFSKRTHTLVILGSGVADREGDSLVFKLSDLNLEGTNLFEDDFAVFTVSSVDPDNCAAKVISDAVVIPWRQEFGSSLEAWLAEAMVDQS